MKRKFTVLACALALIMGVVFASAQVANVSSKWVGGELVFYDVATGASLLTVGATGLTVGGSAGSVVAEGATEDAFETTFAVTDPTADRTITIPDATGTVALAAAAQGAATGCVFVANGIECEGATADAFETTITVTDPAADRAITVPDAAGAISVGFTQDVLFCGQQANNGTVYMSPVSGFGAGAFYAAGTVANDLSYAIGGSGCDAEDDATEGTADEIVSVNNAMKVLGMYCQVSSSGSNGVTLNLRSATADLTPDVTVTIPTGNTTGVANVATTTDIAANATMALKVVNTEDLSAQDAWCLAKVLMVP